MTKEEANKELSRLVQVAEEALSAAEAFADEHKLGFSFCPAYGMGGYYEGDPEQRYADYGEPEGWQPSSQGC